MHCCCLQDIDGRQLLLATHLTLTNLGISSKLQRVQLLNRRDELLLSEDNEQDAPHQNGSHESPLASAAKPWVPFLSAESRPEGSRHCSGSVCSRSGSKFLEQQACVSMQQRMQVEANEGDPHDDSVARLRRSMEISRDRVSWTKDRHQPLVRVLTLNGTTLEEAGSSPLLSAAAYIYDEMWCL